MKTLMLAFAALMLMAAAGPSERPLDNPAQESRALALFKELRCPTCIAQSIHDSNADIARDLRILVREQIAEGRTNAQIRSYLVKRYGDVILLRPPVKSATLPLWLGPWIAFFLGALVVVLVVRRHGRKEA